MNDAQHHASFVFSPENAEKAQEICSRYPEDRRQSAVLPLLDLAQRQNRGWLSDAALSYVASYVGMPMLRVRELAHFYSMLRVQPRGRHLVQLCRTTPCWLRGSDEVRRACLETLGVGMGETTQDGLFTIMEVECLGACCNAPMVQIDDLYYEDLTAEKMTWILQELKAGRKPTCGSQRGRRGSSPLGWPRTENASLLARSPGCPDTKRSMDKEVSRC